nr:antitoxin Xre/MbcA/ParS toxin-binding domain-containing protein [uncultured Cohaesibacter sp.]
MVTEWDSLACTSNACFATKLGLTQAELAKLTGIDRHAFYRRSGLLKLDEAARPLMSILNLASEMTGSDQRAALWFKHQPIPGWAGKTAFDLVSERKSDRVLAYLKSVQSGVYS